MKLRISLLALALSLSTTIAAAAQSIAPHTSPLFLPIRGAATMAVDSSGSDPGDIVTPVILGGLAGALGSVLFAMDSDGPSKHQMWMGTAIGAALGLVVGAAQHARKQ
jgi:hypothetical protein